MKDKEEELQRKAEAGAAGDPNDPDMKAYRLVFNALEKDPGIEVSPLFSEKVIQQVVARQEAKQSTGERIWFGVGFALLLIALIIALAFTGFNINPGMLKGLADYKGLLLLCALMAGLFHFIEKRLLLTEKTPA